MTITRRGAFGLAAGAALVPAWPRPLRAQAFPSKPLTCVVAYPAGGPTDAIARLVAQEISGPLGQNVVVRNEGGASGAAGTRNVARGEPDGHIFTFGNNQTHGNNLFLIKDLGYDPVKDFYPLAGAGAFEHVFVVRKDLPVASIQDLIALAKKDPGKLNYGSTGLGSGSHLSTELFMVRTGIKMQHVPFRGAAPLVQEMVAGRIDIANSTLPSVLGQILSGDLKALALASPKRNANLPDLATLREQGVADADAESWAGFFAPAAAPQAALDRLSREIVTALNKPSVAAAIQKLGFTMNVREPVAFKPYQAQEIAVWGDIIKAAGVKPEG